MTCATCEAYQAEVDAAVADVGDDADRLAHLEAELAKHTAVLQALAATAPEQMPTHRLFDNAVVSVLLTAGCHSHCGPRSVTIRCVSGSVRIVLSSSSIAITWYQFTAKRGSVLELAGCGPQSMIHSPARNCSKGLSAP